MDIKIYSSDGHEVEFSIFKFSAGEIQVKILSVDPSPEVKKDYDFVCREYSSDGIMACILLRNALYWKYRSIERFNILFPYFPYSRQDRVCAEGEANSKGILNYILMQAGFDTISTFDVHSKTGNINNYYPWQFFLPEDFRYFNTLIHEVGFRLVRPDEGATERVDNFASLFSLRKENITQGIKKRDPETGQLSGFDYKGDVRGKKLLIIDDLCDGGGTFIGLAQKLLEGGAKEVRLYVTHGIFSKGIDILLENGISHIYTTDTYYRGESTENLTVFKIVEDRGEV
jgi:ribose-phosphate pyrophosphokinase